MAERRPSAGSSALNDVAQQELGTKYSMQGRTQVAPRVQTMQNSRPTVRSALSNLMRDAVDATGLGGGYRQGLLNAAGGVETAADFLPVVGDVLGLEDASRAYGQGDMVGTGINMMGVVPIIGDAGVKLAKKTRSALRDSGFTEGFFHGTKQDIQDGFKAGYNDGMVFVSPDKEFASNWVGKGKYQDRIGEEDLFDMKQADKQAVWDNLTSQYGDFDNWPEEIVDEWLAKQSAIVRQYDASGGAIYPVAVKANNQFDPESNPEIISEFLTRRGQDPLGSTLEIGKTDLEVYQEGNYLLFENKEMADFLKEKGYDSLWLREDTTKTGLAKPFSTLAVLDETGVKPVYDFAREADTAASALRGLDMSQSARMQRAQDLEFDTERTAYRGLSGEYDPNKAGNYQMFTSSPEDAGEYGSNVVSSYLRKGNNLVVDGGRNNFNSIPVSQLPDNVRANLHSSVGSVARTDDIAFAAQAAGYDSVSINNVFDKAWGEIPLRPSASNNEPLSQEMMDFLDEVNASGMLDSVPDVDLPAEIPKNYDPTTIDIIFDPKNIRSIEAEFDPAKADSADLLSSRQSERQMSALRGIA